MTTTRATEPAPGAFVFNPFEIAVCDPTGRIGEDLALELARFVSFDMHAGIVARPLAASGRSTSAHIARLVTTTEQYVLAVPRVLAGDGLFAAMADLDLVFVVEDSPDSPRPAIVLLGDAPPPPTSGPVVAYVGERKACPILPPDAPYFALDQIALLAQRLIEYLKGLARGVPLYGLVLAGGEAKRMGSEKALVEYDGQPQLTRAVNLLRGCCSRVAVSMRPDQNFAVAGHDAGPIRDRFLGFGPMGGVLSAMIAHPGAAWLVLACDMPLVDKQLLGQLLQERNPFRTATVFLGADDAPEPLCGIYEPKTFRLLFAHMAQGRSSLRSALEAPSVKKIHAADTSLLQSVDTPEGYARVSGTLKSSRGTSPE